MDPNQRYETISQIASGDYATVFRARDHELGREVALRQIHAQYLEDPKQLERYWQEAQLLASLQHPYIVSIYDVVRQRGWVILELMRGSLQHRLAGEAIDLDYLRLTLSYVLHALHFLEQNGIVHGDVKPNNFLLDASNRVKLGDFGIARRLSGDDGSVIKGTTKYMAPEVLSDQFGPVGPHSDLYSLGFSAYELLCGNQFEQLFPGLHMYGRDPQVAWMMWHSAPDRRLPEINRVLEGVPPDLAAIIQKLVEKDPAKRYRRAQDVLADLRSKGQLSKDDKSEEETAALAGQAKQEKQKRMLLIAAVALSVLLSIGMLFMPAGGNDDDDEGPPPLPEAGIVRVVDDEKSLFNMESDEDGKIYRISFNPKVDRLDINGERAELSDLEAGDELKITRLLTQNGQTIQEISVSRTAQSKVAGTLLSVESSIGKISVKGSGDESLRISVPPTVKIVLNGNTQIGNRELRLSDLQVGDRVELWHLPEEGQDVATSLKAKRTVEAKGYVVRFDTENRTVTFSPQAGGSDRPKYTLPLDPEAKVTLNGAAQQDGRVLSLADLKANDRIALAHDTHIHQLDAFRQLTDSGVVRSVDPAAGSLTVLLRGREDQPVTFTLSGDAEIRLRGQLDDIKLESIRPGDDVTITHESMTLDNAVALSVSATARPNKSAWGLVIGQSRYNDSQVAGRAKADEDAQMVYSALVEGYRAPPAQIVLLQNASREQLQQEVDSLRSKIPDSAQLVVYFAGHVFMTDDGQPMLATSGLDLERLSETALPLHWLIENLEQSKAKEQILLLDCFPTSQKLTRPPLAAAQAVALLTDRGNRPASKSVEVIAACLAGQSLATTQTGHGVFADFAARGLAGAADTGGDHQVSSAELFGYLNDRITEYSQAENAAITPKRFEPGESLVIYTGDERAVIQAIVPYLARRRLSNDDWTAFERLRLRSPQTPEVRLLHGMILLNNLRTAEAETRLQAIKQDEAKFEPEHRSAAIMMPVYQALAWQNLLRGRLEDGIADLTEAVRRIGRPRPDGRFDPYQAHLLSWAGELREFVLTAAEDPLTSLQVRSLDNAIINHSDEAKSQFKVGIDLFREKLAELDKQIAAAQLADKRKLMRDRKRLTYYSSLDYDVLARHLQSLVSE